MTQLHLRLVRRLLPGAAVVLAACGLVPAVSGSSPSEPVGAATVTLTPPTAAPTRGGPAALPASSVAPTAIEIPAIGVRAPLDALTLDASGGLERPPHAGSPGWFTGSAVPGDSGPAVIAGHVDSKTGPAVFWRLRDLRVGDSILVTRSDATVVTFRVTRSGEYPQASFPTREVYGPTPDRALRLITCAGTYDHAARRYRDNRVVFAVAA